MSSAEPEFVTESLALLEKRPDLLGSSDLDRARREWQVVEPLVRSRTAFEQRFPGIDLQPIHGDSPPANIFSGVNGDLFSDFELVTLGPVDWDLAALGPDLEGCGRRGQHLFVDILAAMGDIDTDVTVCLREAPCSPRSC